MALITTKKMARKIIFTFIGIVALTIAFSVFKTWAKEALMQKMKEKSIPEPPLYRKEDLD